MLGRISIVDPSVSVLYNNYVCRENRNTNATNRLAPRSKTENQHAESVSVAAHWFLHVRSGRRRTAMYWKECTVAVRVLPRVLEGKSIRRKEY